jgi:hypothetical protein
MAAPKGAFVALRTDMYKDWDEDPERFGAVRPRRSPRPSTPDRATRRHRDRAHESRTPITDKMDLRPTSSTAISKSVMANLDKVPPGASSSSRG